MAVAQKTESRYRVRKPAPTPKRPPSVSPGGARRRGKSEALPGWSDLATANQRLPGGDKGHTFLEKISTRRFALLIVATAILCTLYVGHVHATQAQLGEVQRARKENLRLHLKYNRLKGEFDRMIGPSAIYERARKLDLVEDPGFGPTIHVRGSW